MISNYYGFLGQKCFKRFNNILIARTTRLLVLLWFLEKFSLLTFVKKSSILKLVDNSRIGIAPKCQSFFRSLPFLKIELIISNIFKNYVEIPNLSILQNFMIISKFQAKAKAKASILIAYRIYTSDAR